MSSTPAPRTRPDDDRAGGRERRSAAVVFNPVKVDQAAIRASVSRYEAEAGWGPTKFYETTPDDWGSGVAGRVHARRNTQMIGFAGRRHAGRGGLAQRIDPGHHFGDGRVERGGNILADERTSIRAWTRPRNGCSYRGCRNRGVRRRRPGSPRG